MSKNVCITRLQNLLRDSSFPNVLLKGFFIIVFIGLAFYLLDRIDFPFPQNEVKEDVTNQIIKLK